MNKIVPILPSPPRRQPGGRLKQPTKTERESAARAKIDAEKSTVKAQRLAIGATTTNWTDQRWEEPLGRFCIINKLPSEFYLAGEKLQSDQRRYKLLKGFAASGGNGTSSGVDPDPVLIARLEREVAAALKFIETTEGINRVTMVRRLCFDRHDIKGGRATDLATWGLQALSRYYGMAST